MDEYYHFYQITIEFALRKARLTNIILINSKESQLDKFLGMNVYVGNFIKFDTLVIEGEK